MVVASGNTNTRSGNIHPTLSVKTCWRPCVRSHRRLPTNPNEECGAIELTVDRTLLQERLVSCIRRFPDRKILVVGDAIADQSIFGGISRVSREAPVFILRHEHTDTTP